jgi:hypothetical protein
MSCTVIPTADLIHNLAEEMWAKQQTISTRLVPKTTFISLTSAGGNIGRIHWMNTLQPKSLECIWGAWWFKQTGTRRRFGYSDIVSKPCRSGERSR